eukprot:350149-Chlamydomonas_euryale.AAC.20
MISQAVCVSVRPTIDHMRTPGKSTLTGTSHKPCTPKHLRAPTACNILTPPTRCPPTALNTSRNS